MRNDDAAAAHTVQGAQRTTQFRNKSGFRRSFRGRFFAEVKCVSLFLSGSMSTVLPGKPQSRLQSLASGYWSATQINVS